MPAKRTVLALALTLAPIAFAQPAVPAAEKRISIQFQGTLKDALRQIAEKGGINLVVTGKLDDSTEVYLNDVSAEEALDTVAKTHHLAVGRKGSIWTMRPMTEDEIEEAVDAEAEAADARQEAEDAAQEAADARQEALDQRLQDRLSKLQRKFATVDSEAAGTGTIVVREDQRVRKAVSYGGGLEIYGQVDDDAVAFGGPIKLGPKAVVGGDVVAFGGNIEKAEGAIVKGDTVSMGGSEAGVAISRAIRHSHDRDSDADAPAEPSSHESSSHNSLPTFILWFAVLFGVGFMARMWAPNRMKLLESEIKRDIVKCGVTGLIGAVVISLMTGLMAITIVGIPFAVATWVLGAVGVAMGLAALASEIGMALPLRRIRKTQAIVLALGLLVLLVVSKIPFLGTLVMIAATSLALGAIIRTRFGSRGEGMPERL
jgi:FKBP-type peptidyl-prolyl cis-trans isomerase